MTEVDSVIARLRRQIDGLKSKEQKLIDELDAVIESPDATMLDLLVFDKNKFPASRELWSRIGPTIPPALEQAYIAYKVARQQMKSTATYDNDSTVPSTPSATVENNEETSLACPKTASVTEVTSTPVSPPLPLGPDERSVAPTVATTATAALSHAPRASTRIRSKQDLPPPSVPSSSNEANEANDDDDQDSESDLNAPLVNLRRRVLLPKQDEAQEDDTPNDDHEDEDGDDDGDDDGDGDIEDDGGTSAKTSKRNLVKPPKGKVGRPRKHPPARSTATRVSARHHNAKSADETSSPAASTSPTRSASTGRGRKKKATAQDPVVDDNTPTRRKSARRAAATTSAPTKAAPATGGRKKKATDSE
ncbi:hypothetical protein H310_04724 [Aphanomyces invadans]|uniref:Uncharacterized protein n=2 Tax=Aphanomyces invadans TaxID=157072 RepID=A0A024UE38_9STRA|nr:hypothetical protein H310_04724 [Aphanomyces invadans]ETW04450.1 hypothetical protein H310_04724 [Aphanomyces invadans]|eukprot:XP_008867406.1 hypothetical protein H310_04724 [Aphanomyces invadans]